MIKASLLSICIPAYNHPVWFRRGVESVAVGNGVCAPLVEVVITDDSDHREGEVIAGMVKIFIIHAYDFSSIVGQ